MQEEASQEPSGGHVSRHQAVRLAGRHDAVRELETEGRQVGGDQGSGDEGEAHGRIDVVGSRFIQLGEDGES